MAARRRSKRPFELSVIGFSTCRPGRYGGDRRERHIHGRHDDAPGEYIVPAADRNTVPKRQSCGHVCVVSGGHLNVKIAQVERDIFGLQRLEELLSRFRQQPLPKDQHKLPVRFYRLMRVLLIPRNRRQDDIVDAPDTAVNLAPHASNVE